MRKILLCFVLTVSFVCLAGNGRYSDVTDSIGRLYSNADYYGVIDYSNELLQKHTSGSEACLRMFCYANAAHMLYKDRLAGESQRIYGQRSSNHEADIRRES